MNGTNAAGIEVLLGTLSVEVAFTEYAIAISSELGKRGEYSDWTDPIYEVRETVNRLGRKGARLYTV